VGREALRDAFVLPRAGKPPVVRLMRRGRRAPLDVRVRDEGEGRRMLRALGLDASQTVASCALPSRVVMSRRLQLAVFGGAGALAAIALLIGWLIAPHVPEVWAFLMMAPLFAALVFTRLSQTTLRVGADGLLITWLGTRRFIRYSDVIDVTAYEDPGPAQPRWTGVDVWLESAERLRLPIAPKRALGGPSVAIVEERIREAMDTHRRGDAAADAVLLRRRGREVDGWLRSLRSLGSGASAAHRTAPVLPDRLWRVVEDPSAEASARAGAAVALAVEIDDEGRARLRAAARATAAPKLRIAIEAAADGRGLTEALAEIEAEEEGAAASARRR
jgi:hypothetical protein